MPRSTHIPDNLVVTLTISKRAPAIKLSVLEATVVGLASAGHSIGRVREILGGTQSQLDPTLDQLCRRFECRDETTLWKLLKRRRSRIIE